MENNLKVWIIILISGLITFLIRYFFIQFLKNNVNENLKEFLSFIPPAVLTALVFYGVFDKGIDSLYLSNYRIWAIIVAFFVAWKFKNVLFTIISGMGIIWFFNWWQ
jgi:branched-subunit amino acid transport protein